ncbi:MAG: hypothetical protein KC486_20020, partial [Myxococcales bacterium]|nr:hypothetical protein [Myxococcales bacterium]
MAMASDDWIQESLARLEGLEDERNKTEAALESATDPNELRTLSQRLEQLEGEIAGLYQSLEAAADGDDAGGMGDEPPTGDFVPAGSSEEDDFDADAPTGLFSRDDLASMAAAQGAQLPTSVPQPGQEQLPPQPVAQPQPMAQQPGFGAPAQPGFGAPPQQPGFGAPAQQPSFGAQPGFGAPAQQPSFGGGGGMSADYADLDDDLQPKSKGPLIAIILAVLVLGGVGGYFAFAGGGGGGEEPVDAGPAGPAKVIKAGEVPPDTQGPKGAKGADVDSVEGSQFKEGSRPRSGGGG